MYVPTCWSRLGLSICGIAWEYPFEVTLRMSICAHAQECVTETCINTRGYRWSWRTELRGCFSTMEDGEDSTAGLLQRTYLKESGAETSAEHSRWLATLTNCRSQESKKRTTKSSKVESTYWRVSTSQVLFFLASTKPNSVGIAQPALPACAMRGARHHSHAYS